MCESSGSDPSDSRRRPSSSTSSSRMSTGDLCEESMARPTSYTSVSSTATSASSSSSSSSSSSNPSSPPSSPPSSSQTSRSYSTSSSRDPARKDLGKMKNGTKQKEAPAKESLEKDEEEVKKKEEEEEREEEGGKDVKRESKISVAEVEGEKKEGKEEEEEGADPSASVPEAQGPETVGEGGDGEEVGGGGKERRSSHGSPPDSPTPKASNSCSSSSNSYSLSSPSPKSLSFKEDRESGDFSSRDRSSSKGELTLDEHEGGGGGGGEGGSVRNGREDTDDHTKKVEDKGEKDLKSKEEEGERGGKTSEGGGPVRPGRPGSGQISQKLSHTQLLLQEKLSKGPPLRAANGSKAEEDLEGEMVVKRRSSSKSSDSGEHKAVYRLSMKLAPSLFDTPDFPAANQHQGVEKSGFLNKLSGRSFPYIPQWKRRYCVLSRGKLYYYEREDSKPGDKSTGVLNLEYFDQVAEAGPKECKKATNVFLLTSQDKSFFDPGRHLFSADTLTDMNDWVRKLQTALDNIRRNKRHLTSDHSAKGAPGAGGGNKKKDDNREEKENLSNSSKDRKKRKKEEDSKKKRKSQGVTSETQTREGDEDAPDGAIRPPREGGGGPPGGMVNLAGLGVRLGGGGSSSVVVDEEPKTRQQLENITKHRVKGPSGRRAPQNRRTVIAAKHRASSLSALEFESLNDNRSGSPTPCSPSTSTTTTTTTTPSSSSSSTTTTQEQSSTTDTTTSNSVTTQVSTTTDTTTNTTTTTSTTTSTSESITLSPPITPRSHTPSSRHEYDHDDVESDLFFSDLRRKVRISVGNTLDVSEDESKRKSETLDKEPKRRSTLKVDFAESERRSRSRSKSRMPSLAKLSRFRDTLSSYRKERYVTKDVIEPSHPDAKAEDSWSSSCIVL